MIYLVFSFPLVLIFLPDSFWQKLKVQCTRIFLYFKNIFPKKRSFYGQILLNRAEQLGSNALKTKVDSIEHINYKFYGKLFIQLLSLNSLFGTSVKASIQFFRKSLQKDLMFQRKLEKSQSEAFLQMIFMGLVIWGFFLIFNQLLKIRVSFSYILIVIIYQMLGLLSYLYIEKAIRLRKLKSSFDILKSLIQFFSLLETGISNQEILEKSDIVSCTYLVDKDFAYMLNDLRRKLEKWNETGSEISRYREDVIDEYWFIMEQKYAQILRSVKGVQAIVGFLFFLPSYFLLISFSFKAFLFE